MALKTVVANELRRWGMLSVELQGAFAEDHAIHRDLDAPAEFPDAADEISRPRFGSAQPGGTDEKEEAAAGLAPAPAAATQSLSAPASTSNAPAEQPRRGRRKPAEASAVAPAAPAATAPASPAPSPAPSQAPTGLFADATVRSPQEPTQQPDPEPDHGPEPSDPSALPEQSRAIIVKVSEALGREKVTEAEVLNIVKGRKLCGPEVEELGQLQDVVLEDLLLNMQFIAAQARIDRKGAQQLKK